VRHPLGGSHLDPKHYSECTSHIHSVEILQAGDDKRVGAKMRETRDYYGKTVECIITIIAVSEKPHYSATYSVCYVDDHWNTREANQTGTLDIYLIDDEDGTRSHIMMTNNYVAEGLLSYLFIKGCGWYLRRLAIKYMEKELEDYGAEAVRREQARKAGQKIEQEQEIR